MLLISVALTGNGGVHDSLQMTEFMSKTDNNNDNNDDDIAR